MKLHRGCTTRQPTGRYGTSLYGTTPQNESQHLCFLEVQVFKSHELNWSMRTRMVRCVFIRPAFMTGHNSAAMLPQVHTAHLARPLPVLTRPRVMQPKLHRAFDTFTGVPHLPAPACQPPPPPAPPRTSCMTFSPLIDLQGSRGVKECKSNWKQADCRSCRVFLH